MPGDVVDPLGPPPPPPIELTLDDYGFTAWNGGAAPRIASDLPAAEVLNLDRDVVIRSTVEHCGRVMFMELNNPQYMAYVEVDGEPLPKSSPEDAATIAAALRANVPQGEVA